MAEAGRAVYSAEEGFNNLENEALAGNGGIASKTVAIQGFSPDTNQEVLEMYFESSHRSGGGNIEEFEIKDGIAYVTFKEIEVMQRVVSRRSHQVAGQTLSVTLFCPPPEKPCYENRVLILGLNCAITDELLTNFLEIETGNNITEFLYGEEEKVVVTFFDDIDFPKLGKGCKERSIKGTFLKVAKVAISNCILVQNLKPSTSHDTILFYFENQRRSGGGEVEKVEMNSEERYCLVYFEDNSVINRVLNQLHRVDDTDVEVHLHHECLGRRSSADRSAPYLRISSPGSTCIGNAATGDEKTENPVKEETSGTVSSNPDEESEFVQVPEWQENKGRNCSLTLLVKYHKAQGMKTIRDMKEVPSSLNFLAFWKFYTKTKQGQQMLKEVIAKHGCSVAVSSDDDDLFIFEICNNNFEQESDISDFINVVLDDVYKCAHESLYSDIIFVDHRMQADILQRVRQAKELDCAWIDFIDEQNHDAMYVVCTEDHKASILEMVTAIIADSMKCFENHEAEVTVDSIWQKVLETYGYLQELNEKFPNISVSPDEIKGVFVLKGPRDESKAAADYLLELLGMAHTHVHEEVFSPGCQFEILTYPAMCEYVNNCIQKPSASYTWMPNVQTKNVHIFSTSSEEVRGLDKSIKGCIKEKAYFFSKEDELLQLERCSTLPELKEKYKGKVFICAAEKGTLVVTTADDIFESVDNAIQEIIRKERVTDAADSKTEKGDKKDEEAINISEMKGTDLSKTAKESHPEKDITFDPVKEHLQESLKLCDNLDKLDVEVEPSQETNRMSDDKRTSDEKESQTNIGAVTGSLFVQQDSSKLRIEVTKAVLDCILLAYGDKGKKALISDLKLIANVDTSNDKVIVLFDPRNTEAVQACLFQHYNQAQKVQENREDNSEKHLIDGGQKDIIEMLQFAYRHCDWIRKLYVEQDKLFFLGPLHMKEEVQVAVQVINQWCHVEIILSSDEEQIAEEATSLVRNEFPGIFIKRTSDRIIMKGENADSILKAKHKAIIALGRVIKIGRTDRNAPAVDESLLSLPEVDIKEASILPFQSNPQVSRHIKVISSNTYYTREGITVKVYQGDIVKLPVDCIVSSSNEDMIYTGGVALAIAKAAGSQLDQEGNEYVRKHGPVAVTQCCVTSAGRLPYICVIHAVGPRWHEYKQDKDRCGEDLKKTIVTCLIEANQMKATSIAIPSISSRIFGVPGPLCGQMYAQGVLEFSKTFGLQSIKEIHFVDIIFEMCHLIQQAFDKEFNSPSSTSSKDSGDTNQSHILDNQLPAKPRLKKPQKNFPFRMQNETSTSHRQTGYTKVLATRETQGTKQNPYIFKPLEHLSILIYNHNITDVDVDAVVCPVCQDTEGDIVQSVKRSCGPAYANTDFQRVMADIKNEGEVIITHVSNIKIHFHKILHVYSSPWIGINQDEDCKGFEKHMKSSMKNIFDGARKIGVASIALPVPGFGDKTGFNQICEYMMVGLVDFCADHELLPAALTAIHLVAKDLTMALKVNEIAIQKFDQSHELTGKKYQSSIQSVKHSQFGTSGLQVIKVNNNPKSFTQTETLSTGHHSSMKGHESQEKTCPICMDTTVDPRAFKGCGHVLCRECMEFTVKKKPVCPVCGKIYGIITGNQPQGTMEIKTSSICLPGFRNCGTINIFYSFPSGIQTEEHPNPGLPYQGTKRRAYLPDNVRGRKVLSLLKKAFDRRLVFTIGRSMTRGTDNVVTWNDICHKTNREGGPHNYGYPDEDYLARVEQDLAAKGVTEDN